MKLNFEISLRVNTWIRVALRPIRLPLTRRTLRREFLEHFEDCRDAQLDKGLTERQAEEKALELLGSASGVAKLLKLVYRPRIYLVRAAILLLVLLYLLPWPTRITRQMYGTVYWMDGSPPEAISFTVEGWKLDYLFRDDKLNLELTWGESEEGDKLFQLPLLKPKEALGYETGGLLFDATPGVWDAYFGPVYQNDDLFEPTYTYPIGHLTLSRDGTSCLLSRIDGNWYVLAANTPSANENELRALYGERLENILGSGTSVEANITSE